LIDLPRRSSREAIEKLPDRETAVFVFIVFDFPGHRIDSIAYMIYRVKEASETLWPS
jgi:hypothetical protein